jgi:hypothetical protein
MEAKANFIKNFDHSYFGRLLGGAGIIVAFVLTLFVHPASAANSTATLSVDEKPALILTVPATAKTKSTNGWLNIQTPNLTLNIWVVLNAKTTDDALPRMGDLIKSEFLNFKTNGVMEAEIAGAPAKHVTGSGNEADDHDPGNAEVVVFVTGGRVFVACVHGEADEAAKARAAMMAVLKTAHSP